MRTIKTLCVCNEPMNKTVRHAQKYESETLPRLKLFPLIRRKSVRYAIVRTARRRSFVLAYRRGPDCEGRDHEWEAQRSA